MSAARGLTEDDAKYPEREEATMITANAYTTTPAAAPERSERIATGRLIPAGVLTALAAAGATTLVRAVAVALGAVPADYPMLQPGGYLIGSSVLGVLGATLVLGTLARAARRPIRAFRITAGVVLALSLASPLAAAAGKAPGGAVGASTVVTMMLLHLVVAAVAVTLLPLLARERDGGAA